jgi:hypothetical protein
MLEPSLTTAAKRLQAQQMKFKIHHDFLNLGQTSSDTLGFKPVDGEV